MDFFLQIPRHNQLDVLKKLDFKDFTEFKQCCKETVEITKNFRHRLRLWVSAFKLENNSLAFKRDWPPKHGLDFMMREPVRLKVDQLMIRETHSEPFEFLEEVCRKTQMKVDVLLVDTDGGYDPMMRRHLIGTVHEQSESWMVDKLIKLVNPSCLRLSFCSSAYLLSLQELNRVGKIEFYYGMMSELDFLSLKHSKIEVAYNQLKSSVVNNYLKQWAEEKREIVEISIWYILPDDSDIFKDLEFTVLWSHKTDPSPPVPDLINQLRRRNKGRATELKEFYSLKRNDGKKIFIAMVTFRGSLQLIAYEDNE